MAKRELDPLQTIERSIFKKYRKEIWAPFLTGITRYRMIQENDKIAVCISGGKDSMLMAKLLELLQRHSDVPFELVYLSMDPGYNQENKDKIRENAATLGLDLQFFDTNILKVANSLAKTPCYLCARMRRGALYAKAKELGCNKIALGHHLNDAIETTLMSMFYSSKLETIVPKYHSDNFPGMELIRPMYCVKEENILKWCRYNHLSFIQCACSFTTRTEDENDPASSKRLETKLLIAELKKNNPEIEDNIFRALHSVQIATFPGYKLNDTYYSFLEDYESEEEKEKLSVTKKLRAKQS